MVAKITKYQSLKCHPKHTSNIISMSMVSHSMQYVDHLVAKNMKNHNGYSPSEHSPLSPNHWPLWHVISQVTSLGSGQLIVTWSPFRWKRAWVGIGGSVQPNAEENIINGLATHLVADRYDYVIHMIRNILKEWRCRYNKKRSKMITCRIFKC